MQPARQTPYNHATAANGSVLATNQVLRNTYLLLSMTLLFSAVCTFVGMQMNFGGVGILGFFLGAYGLMFLTHKLQNSVWGLAAVFGFTGFMGFTLAPMLNAYLNFLPNGGQLVLTAIGGTGLIFMGLSAYALASGKRFNNWGASLLALGIVAMIAMVANIFLQIPALSMAVSALFMLFSSAVIVYHTGEIVHGGETNYITATISLYVSIYNIFVSLLSLLGMTSDE
jgi:modulator of FtsH protease